MNEVQEEVFKLDNMDPDDIYDVIVKIEKSFNIEFGTTELQDVKTFGELCDIIISKIELQNREDCTTQQGFYKLRDAISKVTCIERTTIAPNTQLEILFPKKSRRHKIKLVGMELGFSVKVLRAKKVFLTLFPVLLFVSLVSLFFSWQIGLLGIIVSLLGAVITNKLGNELSIKNVGGLVEKLSRENYMDLRRNKNTVNRIEVVQKIKQLFSHDLGLESQYLTRDATFN